MTPGVVVVWCGCGLITDNVFVTFPKTWQQNNFSDHWNRKYLTKPSCKELTHSGSNYNMSNCDEAENQQILRVCIIYKWVLKKFSYSNKIKMPKISTTY